MLERKTTISTRVLSELKKSGVPLSVGQLMSRLETHGLKPNKTTIYRILEKLSSDKTVTEVSLRNGVTYYEITRGGHHHHFVCNSCDTVFCLGGCHLNSLHIDLSKLVPNSNFKIQSHDFNLYGICEPCST